MNNERKMKIMKKENDNENNVMDNGSEMVMKKMKIMKRKNENEVMK